ncbi:MAG: hypothetical protein KME35_05035 [Aphanocapsa sp. GSE-SYN-MK-11-07L]|nr:hypothetical protein [Aphanocapsa sp. GSE-SYN-MK-11-07L]
MSESEENLVTAESAAQMAALLQSLRRKEGNWVAWGHACQTLQKGGYTPQAIFEATGFEPIQQNQIITAAQIYETIREAAPDVREYFGTKGSDVLYEFRILTQPERVKAASLAWEKELDAESAHDLAKALKDFSRLARLPEGFNDGAGDAVAYQCWKLARQQDNLQERSRLIARGLSYAETASARQQIEKLLTDFTVVKTQAAPRLPLYRLDSEEDLPRMIPIIGCLPLTKADLRSVPLLEEQGPFRMVQFKGEGAWVAVPGWQVILAAEDPVGLFTTCDRLPANFPGGNQEQVLVIVDRQQREWRSDSYFLVERSEQIEIQWFESEPTASLLAQVILVMRPKQILDESATTNLWLMDE